MIVAAIAATATPAGAAWQNFRASQAGLADNLVYSISEAFDGAMWFGTAKGANRFDGSQWITFADSLPSLNVLSMVQDRRGRWWLGMETGGIARLDGTRWAYFRAENGFLPANQVGAMIEDHRGDLWFGTFAGLVRLQPDLGTWTTYSAGPGALVNPQVQALLEDSAHNLWVATPEGATRIDSTRTAFTSFTEDLNALGRDSVLALGEDATGGVWFGTDRGAWRMGANGWTHVTAADGLASDVVTAFARDSLGLLWIGTVAGITRYDGKTFRSDDVTNDGTTLGPIATIRIDRAGNAWLATASHGLFRYDAVAWRNYFAAGGTCAPQFPPEVQQLVLASNCEVVSLQDRAGDLWFASVKEGTSRLARNGAWSVLRRTGSIPVSDSITALVEDRKRFLWFGSTGAGLARVDSTRSQWKIFTRQSGLPGDSVLALHVDHAGVPWAGTTNGAGSLSGPLWTNFLYGGLDGQRVEVRGFLEDRDDNLWMRTSVGLFSLDATRTQLDRYGSAQGLTDSMVTAMTETRDGAVWFGTGGGLHRFAQGVWTSYPTFGSAGDSVVYALHEDAQGALWVAGDRGVVRIEGANQTTFTGFDLGSTPALGLFEDSGGSIWVATYIGLSRYNGSGWRLFDSRSVGLAPPMVTSFLEDSQHRLWFGGPKGLTEHEPDRTSPQTLFVTERRALLPSRNVTFVFGAGFGEFSDLEYSLSWDGALFSPFTSDNTFTQTGVPDGLHTLEVRSRDWVRNTDPTPAMYNFEVDATPPAAVLSSPSFGQAVRGTITIAGNAADARFHDYRVDARPFGLATWSGPLVQTLATSTTPITDATLTNWNTTTRADGDYEVRLSVTDTLGLTGVSLVRVIVDNVAPFANVTSPARITAATGGDVFTTNSDVHLYFPPHAFSQDAQVTIRQLLTSEAPDTLPSGAIRQGAGWEVNWTGAQLEKNATLEMRPVGVTPPAGRPLAVYATDGTGGWRRQGGTAANGALAMPLRDRGRFALYADDGPTSTGGGLGPITLSPRAFSPSGSFASTDIAIGFSLGRSGSATVKIYNRAGRMMRTVSQGVTFGAGENLVRWDGRDRDGAIVASGLYLVTVEALGDTKTQTLSVVK